MKVHDIRSFFKSPKAGTSSGSSASQVVEISPNRSHKASEGKRRKPEEDAETKTPKKKKEPEVKKQQPEDDAETKNPKKKKEPEVKKRQPEDDVETKAPKKKEPEVKKRQSKDDAEPKTFKEKKDPEVTKRRSDDEAGGVQTTQDKTEREVKKRKPENEPQEKTRKEKKEPEVKKHSDENEARMKAPKDKRESEGKKRKPEDDDAAERTSRKQKEPEVKKRRPEDDPADMRAPKNKKESEGKKRKPEDDVDTRTPKKKKEEPKKPEMTPEEKKRTQVAGYFKYMSRGGPKNLGSKEVPIGAKDCLKNLTFVSTGVMDSFERDDIKQMVEKYGGRLTGSVSGKTSYLLVGDEPGEAKIKKAKDLKVPQITEDEFLELIRKSNPNQPTKTKPEFFGASDDEDDVEMTAASDDDAADNLPCTPIPAPAKNSSKVQSKASSKSPAKSEKAGANARDKTPIKTYGTERTPTKSPAKPEVKTPENDRKSREKTSDKSPVKPPVKPEVAGPSKTIVKNEPAAVASQSIERSIPTVAGPPSLMWVDKYRPVAVKNVIGQSNNANKLLKWLENWFDNHGQAGEKAKAAWPGLRDPEGKTFKAALLSGPPGIGKTTTAHLCCKQVGYDYFEMNASDTRNKNGLHGTVADSLDNRTMFKSGEHKNELTSKHVLIMDEVDGMSGNEDRGGIQELIGLIKKSRVPIICICNDRNHMKIRSLANYCFDLRFPKPTNEQIKGLIQSLCHKEKLKLPYDSVQKLISSTEMDIRQIINQLELIKASTESGGNLYNPKKDIKFGPWDVCRKVFSAHEHRGMSFQDKSSLFFQDYSFGPLFVQENYLRWTPLSAKNKYEEMDLIMKSASAIATGDLVDNLIRRNNNWSLLPTQAIFSSLLPGEYMAGDVVSGIEFPRWLGKNSNKSKVSRLLQQLHTHVHLQVSGSLEALNMDYLPYLRRSIVNPLAHGELDQSADVMQEYSLLREDLDSINEVSLWPGMKNPMDKLDSKTKAAFTRRVNKEVLPYSVVKIVKGKGRKGAGGIDDELEGLEEDDEGSDAEDNEEDEKLESDAMIKIRTSKSKAAPKQKETKKKVESKKKEPAAGPSKRSRK